MVAEPRGASITCPKCSSKLKENGHRRLKCLACNFEADRDTIEVLNSERRPYPRWGSGPHDCPADGRCKPEQMRGTGEPPKGTLAL